MYFETTLKPAYEYLINVKYSLPTVVNDAVAFISAAILTSEVVMQSAALKTNSAPVVPTVDETALILLSPSGGLPKNIEKKDIKDDLINIKYYSPTSD